MGRRGPAPTPTPILKLRSSSLVTKRREQREPKPQAGPPRCPSWLDTDARAAWRQLAPQLKAMRVLTKIDGHALARYCRFWSRWRRAEAFIEKNGDVYPLKDENGRIKCLMPFPQVAVANKLAQQLTRLEQEFGMTPSARTRIRVERAEEQVDPLQEFLANA